MIQVKLMGELGEKFGTDWQSAGHSYQDIVKLIDCQTEGFAKTIEEMYNNDIGLEVIHGEELLFQSEEEFNEAGLQVLKDTVIITPVAVGSAKGRRTRGFIKLLTAALTIYLAVITGGASASLTTNFGDMLLIAMNTKPLVTSALFMTAGLLATSGMADLMYVDTFDSPESKLFGNENVNNIRQGAPIPLCYGEMIIPGVPINVGFMDIKTAAVNYSDSSGENVQNEEEEDDNNPHITYSEP